MISVNTNIVVRFLTQDDPDQYLKTRHLIGENSIIIPETVILETEWVLRYAYQYQPAKIRDAFMKLSSWRTQLGFFRQ